jgi:hypothetical protein
VNRTRKQLFFPSREIGAKKLEEKSILCKFKQSNI